MGSISGDWAGVGYGSVTDLAIWAAGRASLPRRRPPIRPGRERFLATPNIVRPHANWRPRSLGAHDADEVFECGFVHRDEGGDVVALAAPELEQSATSLIVASSRLPSTTAARR